METVLFSSTRFEIEARHIYRQGREWERCLSAPISSTLKEADVVRSDLSFKRPTFEFRIVQVTETRTVVSQPGEMG